MLAEILGGIEREHQAISIDSVQAKIAASTACHAAIKVNMPLDLPKMEWLLWRELAEDRLPMSCPHGRPVLLRYSLREIERAFKRDLIRINCSSAAKSRSCEILLPMDPP